ncbi:Protein ssuh2 [Balamuthia mandrillaris]
MRAGKQNKEADFTPVDAPDLTPRLCPPPASFVPPPPDDETDLQQGGTIPEGHSDALTTEEALSVIERYVEGTWWRERGATRRILVEDFSPGNAYHVTLESFTEERQTVPVYRPYRGGEKVDEASQGRQPPHPWSVDVRPSAYFVDKKVSVPLPHTDNVQRCFECWGRGRKDCQKCEATGSKTCKRCGGEGKVRARDRHDHAHHHRDEDYDKEPCRDCQAGKVRCGQCGGTGSTRCATCEGEGMLLHSIRLDVRWKTKVDDRLLDYSALDRDLEGSSSSSESAPLLGGKDPKRSELPSFLNAKKFRKGGGVLLHHETANLLPLTDHRTGLRVAPNVNNGVNTMLQEAIVSDRYIHHQRLKIRGMPLYKMVYRDNGERKVLWVYGTERKVYMPDYPLSTSRISLFILVSTLIGVLVAVGVAVGVVVPFVLL